MQLKGKERKMYHVKCKKIERDAIIFLDFFEIICVTHLLIIISAHNQTGKKNDGHILSNVI